MEQIPLQGTTVLRKTATDFFSEETDQMVVRSEAGLCEGQQKQQGILLC